MPFVTEDVVVRQLDPIFWELREPIVYQGNTDTFTVPEGFVTDFASVPRVFMWLLPRYGAYTRAAILHDHLVRSALVDRSDADGLFRRVMRELSVPFARRWMMWAAVRAGSFLADARPRDVLQFAIAAPLSLAFVVIPAVVVQVFLGLFWVIELLLWAARRIAGRHDARPHLEVTSTS